jgi:2-isopropylmalate synthase
VHLGHQLRKSQEQVEEMAATCVARARQYTSDVEFSPMDATRSKPEFLATLVRAALTAGARTINIPDTVGCARPDQVGALLRDLQKRVPELEGVVLSFHGQNDLGLATANALAAVQAGARQVEVTVNGIGERAGNTSLEEFVMVMRLHGEALGACTRIDAKGIYALSQLVEERSQLAVSANKPIVGRNAFRHASGIHQDGVLKRRETYECVDPQEIGHPVGSQIVLGKLSGRHGFAARVKALGIQLDGKLLDQAFARFQRVADEKREVLDMDLRRICGDGEPWPGPGI